MPGRKAGRKPRAKHSLCDLYQRGAQNFVVEGALVAGFAVGGSPMTAIIQAASRLTRTDVDSEPLKAILIFSGIGLLLSLIAIQAYGLDFSAGFF